MALQLYQELPTGISGNYWKIIRATVDCDKELPTVDISLALWISRLFKINQKESIHLEIVRLNLDEIDSTFSYDFRACLYNSLKQIHKWADATDVLEDDGS